MPEVGGNLCRSTPVIGTAGQNVFGLWEGGGLNMIVIEIVTLKMSLQLVETVHCVPYIKSYQTYLHQIISDLLH